MLSVIFDLTPLLVGLALIVVWVISLIRTDGMPSCDPKECDTCPFPCEGHDTNKNIERELS